MYNDDLTQSIAKAAQEVLEGYGKKKMKKEEVKYPHDMFHPETGEKKVAKDESDHKALEAKGYTHEKPDVSEVSEPEDKGHKKFKAMHKVKTSGENEDGSVVKEAKYPKKSKFPSHEYLPKSVQLKGFDKKKKKGLKKSADGTDTVKLKGFKGKKLPRGFEEVEVEEGSAKQEKYKKFFTAALEKFGVKSPAELEGEKKKEFFDYVDANYNADNESDVDESLIGSIKKAASKLKDKVTGADKKKKAAGDAQSAATDALKGTGARRAKINADPKQKIKNEQEKIKGYIQKIKDAEKKNRDGDISDDKLDSTEEYYNELINNAEDRIDELGG